MVWRWEGTAFGDTPPNEDPDGDGKKTTINIAWPGTYRDAESSLYLNGARYFDAKTWRFLTPDPTSVMEHFERWRSHMGVPGVPPFEANPYVRVLNNPLRWIDRTGREAFPGDTSWSGPGYPTTPDAQVSDVLTERMKGEAQAAKACLICVAKCEAKVLTGAGIEHVAEKQASKELKKVEDRVVKEFLKRGLKFAGWVGAVQTGADTIQCYVECK